MISKIISPAHTVPWNSQLIYNCPLKTSIWMSHSHLKQNMSKMSSYPDRQDLLLSWSSLFQSMTTSSFQSLRLKSLTHPWLFSFVYTTYNQPIRKLYCFYLQMYTECDCCPPTPLPPADLRAPPFLAWIVAVSPCVSVGFLGSRYYGIRLQEIGWVKCLWRISSNE